MGLTAHVINCCRLKTRVGSTQEKQKSLGNDRGFHVAGDNFLLSVTGNSTILDGEKTLRRN